jgi:hypothetical protein
LRAPRGRIALRRDLLSRATSPHGQPVGAAAAAQASGQPTRQKKYQKKKKRRHPFAPPFAGGEEGSVGKKRKISFGIAHWKNTNNKKYRPE